MCSTFDAAASDFEIVEMRSNISKEKLIEQKGMRFFTESCLFLHNTVFICKEKENCKTQLQSYLIS